MAEKFTLGLSKMVLSEKSRPADLEFPYLIENRFAWWATHRVAPTAFANHYRKIIGSLNS
jgi:hypothetical protein